MESTVRTPIWTDSLETLRKVSCDTLGKGGGTRTCELQVTLWVPDLLATLGKSVDAGKARDSSSSSRSQEGGKDKVGVKHLEVWNLIGEVS